MPWVGVKNPSQVSTLVIDADLDLGTHKLKTDHITESTSAHKVVGDVAISSILESLERTYVGSPLASNIKGDATSTHNHAVSYTKVLEWTIPAKVYDAEFYTVLSIHTNNASYATTGRIYKNDVGVGTEHVCAINTPTPYAETLGGFDAGDKLQVYIKQANAGYEAWYDSFYIYAYECGGLRLGGSSPTW